MSLLTTAVGAQKSNAVCLLVGTEACSRFGVSARLDELRKRGITGAVMWCFAKSGESWPRRADARDEIGIEHK